MPTPITFSVPAARRSGTFSTAPVTLPAGYTLIRWQLTIPNTSEYENPANGFTAELHATPPGGPDGVYGSASWTGGRDVNKAAQIDPPPEFAWGLDPSLAGASLVVKITLVGTYTVGIANGVLS